MGAEVLGPILDLLGTVGINIYNQEQQKKKNELDYQRQMEAEKREYERNIEIWNMQNAYNHPQQQMTRLRQAGLNPNLVYGKGADNTATAISSTKSKAPEFGVKDLFAPNMTQSINSAITTYNNAQQTKANIDQTHEAIALMQKEQLIKDSELANKNIKNAKDQFDLEQAQALKETVIERAKLENKNIESNTQIGIDRNEREKLMNAKNMELVAQQIINSKVDELLKRQQYAQTETEMRKIEEEIKNLQVMNENLKTEGVLKKFQAEMTKRGINPNDAWYWRELNRALKGEGAAQSFLEFNDKFNKAIGWERDPEHPLGWHFNWYNQK
jgi:hypothetical protein